MRRWTGWYQPRPLRIHSDYARVRVFLPDEDAAIERYRGWHRRTPLPCGFTCHRYRECGFCWQIPPGWTIRTVRNTGRTR